MHELVDLILNVVFIDHGIFFVMIMRMGRMFVLVMMDEGALALIFCMMSNSVHQNRKTGLLPGGDWNGRNSQHLRKPVKIDLHSPFLYNIHHI